MTKEITKAIILQEIEDKFGLRDLTPEKFTFNENVVPTYNIGPHVKNWVSKKKRIQVTGNLTIVYFEVPQNERWFVRRLDVMNEPGGNFDVTQVLFYKSTDIAQYVFYDTVAPLANDTVTLFTPTQDIPMEYAQLKTLQIQIANFVAGGWVTLRMLTEVETIR